MLRKKIVRAGRKRWGGALRGWAGAMKTVWITGTVGANGEKVWKTVWKVSTPVAGRIPPAVKMKRRFLLKKDGLFPEKSPLVLCEVAAGLV